ncbi:hypothetical protein O181_026772 [Austropuccinia psidii MF-1]|uniref:Reverse transcriptase Ty1/copia-type domain-containing protein n=1 Tax=Austropuccinia psidii MF-1 TaxID=1389203 RepID=A0A9Q3CNP7_9BASI|nr:hypothetical protein [Austropuccinia psidii MF-1]
MKDLDNLGYVLGMKVTRNQIKFVIFLSQELYINSLVDYFGTGACKPVLTPQVPPSKLLPLAITDSEPAKIHYQRDVGLLNYLVSCTRPDLAYSASCISQFLSFPSHHHELTFIKIQIFLWKLCFLYGLIGWKTTKKELVARSSMEAEYRSISNCCQDVCWLLELVSDFGISIKANWFCDNQGALALLKNSLYQHQAQHIKLGLHWCCQLLKKGNVDVKYISTEIMPANILTKFLGRKQHLEHCSALGFSSLEPGRTLTKSSLKVTEHEKENSSERNNLEVSTPIPSIPDPGPDSIENSTERIISKTNLPVLSRTDPEPDSNPPLMGKSPRSEWIPENEPPPKEILGKLGDPRNMIKSRI